MLRIYNTLTNRIEEISTFEPGLARLYTCGPTVYRHAHIGNLRSYLLADWIRRALRNQQIKVVHIKNITDVGHMRQHELEEEGDKVILAALAVGKTPKQIAEFYTQSFHRDEAKLNILTANHFPKASEFVPQMIMMIKRLLDKQHAYRVNNNVYFDVSSFAKYGVLSGNIGLSLIEGIRNKVDPLKKHPRDFALWKEAEKGRQMKWPSPWGEGFPGWHIECSAMSTYYLGDQQDIHTGGVDNIFPHHEDEIAQSEAASSKQYVRYWVHGQHLLANGVKMSKSTNNEVTLTDLEERGISPLSFRYLCLTIRYRHRMNFTFSALKAAEKSLTKLKDLVWMWNNNPSTEPYNHAHLLHWSTAFWEAINNDLDMPKALAVTWMMARSPINTNSKLNLIHEFDSILGLDLIDVPESYSLPYTVRSNIKKREQARGKRDFAAADAIKVKILETGSLLRDTHSGTLVRPKTDCELKAMHWPLFPFPKEISSYIDSISTVQFSLVVSSGSDFKEIRKCIQSVIKWSDPCKYELIAIDNDTFDQTGQWLRSLANTLNNLKVIHFDQKLGAAQAINMGLKQSKGHIIIILDPATELTGDLLADIECGMVDKSVAVLGPWGLRTKDLRHFHEEVIGVGEADAMQGYCFAFRRSLLNTVGLMRECFQFYRNLDLDFSFQFRDLGHRIVSDNTLPIIRHTPSIWNSMELSQIDKLSKKNFGHFLKRWRDRSDLLLSSS